MTTSSSQTSQKRRTRLFALLAGFVLLLGIAWAGVWLYLAGQLDRRVASAIDAAAGGGTRIECANREISGFPFRIGLRCDSVSVDAEANGIAASAGALRTAAQLYRPGHVVGEIDGPLVAVVPNMAPVEFGWDLAQASTSLWTEGLERVSVAVDNPRIRLVDAPPEDLPIARSQRLELHARRNGEALDFAFTDMGLVVVVPGLGPLAPFDLTGDMSVDGAARWLSEGIPGGDASTALRGEAGTLRSVRFVVHQNGALDLSGPFTVSEAGEISGDFRLGIENPQAIADVVGVLFPAARSIATTVAGTIGLAGRQENGRTVIDVQVRDGEMRLGFIPLGRLPRI